MKIIKNENSLDRFIRLIISELLFILAFFWLNSLSAMILYIVALIMLVTSISGFCGLYTVFKINTTKYLFIFTKIKTILAVLLFVVIGGVGVYYSNFFSKKFFLEDYNQMNNFYKQTLFFTGQEKRTEAMDNYKKLTNEYPKFLEKYSSYHPYVIKGDKKFNNDIAEISNKIISLQTEINTGNLLNAHKELESIRPVFQDILKRNGFSMLAVALVDFHDAMEIIISAADEKNATGIITAYPEVDMKLKAVEEVANDEEIQLIRQKLEEVYGLAKDGKIDELSAKAAEMKSSFVKVYLKRG